MGESSKLGRKTYVGKRSVAKGILRRDSMGFFVSRSQPKASAQGALTSDILTLPDSVRRSPMLFQLCFLVLAATSKWACLNLSQICVGRLLCRVDEKGLVVYENDEVQVWPDF